MLDTSRERILRDLPDDALVLDIGGWGKPFPRADWVVDMKDYATRGLYGREPGGEERFSADTWVQQDVCGAAPLPFEDDRFDFVVCSQTLEDVRDPVRVCAEIMRVGKAGYIETPSRLEEQSYGFQGPWVGWGHHHWMVETGEGRIEFVFKHHVMHGRDSDHFPAGFYDTLTPEERVETLWWEGSFEARERFIEDADELDAYLADFVSAELAKREFKPRRRWFVF
jgi:methyltransferase family protein